MKRQNRKFSITIDEYTSVRRIRYFSINLHDAVGKNVTNLGLVRVLGSLPAELMAKMVDQHVSDFGLKFESDIVATTNDGARVMEKFGRLIPALSQICLNHGIHLGVCDTLYKNKKEKTSEPDQDFQNDEDDFQDQGVIDYTSDEEAIDCMELLKSVRKVVTFIRSSVRNRVFQEKVLAEKGKEKELSLDVKTRWNSIPTMLESVLETKKQIIDTCSELNVMELVDNLDFGEIKCINDAMMPIKLTVEALSREDATLITAEVAIQFMFSKLHDQNNEISRNLLENLKQRMNQRVNSDIMDLMKSLRNPNSSLKKTSISIAQSLLKRLFLVETEATEPAAVQVIEGQSEISLKDELEFAIQSAYTEPLEHDDFMLIKSEFTLFKNTGKRTTNLQRRRSINHKTDFNRC